jgi:hypothetical protein
MTALEEPPTSTTDNRSFLPYLLPKDKYTSFIRHTSQWNDNIKCCTFWLNFLTLLDLGFLKIIQDSRLKTKQGAPCQLISASNLEDPSPKPSRQPGICLSFDRSESSNREDQNSLSRESRKNIQACCIQSKRNSCFSILDEQR